MSPRGGLDLWLVNRLRVYGPLSLTELKRGVANGYKPKLRGALQELVTLGLVLALRSWSEKDTQLSRIDYLAAEAGRTWQKPQTFRTKNQ